ncbi:MAG: biosynthetic arginine decarboxylase [Campylobacterota bacterium]|nr:biosynthetic arginine decarboxylase [Campylobacterota bacterium]
MRNYGIDIFSDNNFIIEKDKVVVKHKSQPSIFSITEKIRASGIRGPLILRFPHIIKKQIDSLFINFHESIKEYEYKGDFRAVFPLKVNQYPNVLKSILESSKEYNYGLEAGSKAELILAMNLTPVGSPITVNGFKDEEMINLGFIAAQMGHNITITIEGINELESIINIANQSTLKVPNIGIRVRLHSGGTGVWAKSGGMESKFGLTSTELLEAIKLLKENSLIDSFKMIHFHIGSQMSHIKILKKALREAGNIYAELKMLGSVGLDSINIGGGLAIEYAQHTSKITTTYDINEFSNSVIFTLMEIMDKKDVKHPHIYTESGRYVVAAHGVLVAPVIELFSADYQEKSLIKKESNPPIIDELYILNSTLKMDNALEFMHDSIDHLESILTLFDLGYLDLQDRSNGEILVHQIIKKALLILKDEKNPELERLQERLQEKYLINSSIFQSMPDFWGLKQHFPVMPITKLDTKPIRSAALWDITCDSDGEIEFDPSTPLYLHDVDLDNEEYFLAFFNVGAYQETLGMKHNLFTHPTECSVIISDDGFKLENINESSSILDILSDLGYDKNQILRNLKSKLSHSDFVTEEEKSDTIQQLEIFLYQNGYLRTTY